MIVVFFVAGLLSPKWSRRLQEKLKPMFRKAEEKGDDSAGRVGDWTGKAVEKTREVGDKSAEQGRKVHYKVSGQPPDEDP